MKTIRSISAMILFLAPAEARGQTPNPPNSLGQGLAILGSLDANKDGKLSSDELAVFGIAKGEFVSADADGDGSWSRDEFLVFYRQRLQAKGLAAAPDLEAEVARIQALRKAKAVEDGRVRRTGVGDPSTNRPLLSRSRIVASDQARQSTGTDPVSNSIEGRLLAALDALERRANGGGASKEDYERVRELLIERAREADMAAKGADTDAGVQSETHRKLLQSLERIEKRAGEGVWSREEFQAFRDGVIRRARNIVNGANGTGGTPAVVPAADTGALEPSLQAAVDVLEKHAAAGQATAVDFQAVRDQLAIRARSQARGASQAEQVAASETYVKLIQSLDRLEARAAQGGYSREEFAALRSSFVKRARNIDGASSPGSPAAANAGVNTSSTGAAPLAPPELTAIEKGLIDALDGLEKRVAAGGATREDWQRVRDQLSARARSAVAGLSPAEVQTQGETYRKLEQSLERLEKRASEGPYSREEFDVLRQAFTRRARNIVGDSAGSSNSQTGSDGSSVIKFDGATGRAERAPTARDKGAETPAPGPAGEPKTQRPQPAPVVEPKPERPLPAGETPKPERPAPIPPAPPAPSERPKPEPPERPPHSA